MLNIQKYDLLEKAHLFARLCKMCYLSDESLKIECKKYNFPQPTNIKCDNAHCLVFFFHNDIVVAIQGTNDKQDILSYINLFFADTAIKDGYIHSGFLCESKKIADSLPSFQVDKRNLWFCGHSLGAAIAIILSTKFFPKELFTFGSPRVGNKVWVDAYNSISHHRFVNNNDIVCRIPNINYWHHGQEHYINYYGNVLDSPGYFQKLADRARGHLRALAKFQKFDSLYDHGMNQYIKKISLHV